MTIATPLPNAYRAGLPVPLALRVGVTGHRPHKISDTVAVERAIKNVIGDIREACEAINDKDKTAGKGSSKDDATFFSGHEEAPILTLMSALAEGADRMVAKAARDKGFLFVAVLPFSQDKYCIDFKPKHKVQPPYEGSVEDPENGTVTNFEDLLSAADKTVVLDGDDTPGDKRNKAYLEAGRFIVGQSDILIAVWNGQPAEGTGGTGEIVAEARRQGVPVVHVFADRSSAPGLSDGELRLLPGADTNLPATAPLRSAAPYCKNALYEVLEERVRSPHMVRNNSLRQRTFACERGFKEPDCQSTPDYQRVSPIAYDERWRMLVGVFDRVRNLIVSRAFIQSKKTGYKLPDSTPLPPPTKADREPLDRLFAAYVRTDAISYFFSKAYRSTVLGVYLLGTLAIACAILALVWKEAKLSLAITELAILAAIFLLVALDRYWLRFHRRWLDYRVVAELLRPTIYLALLGRTIRLGKIRDTVGDTGENEHQRAHHLPSREWAYATYRAIVRYAGVGSADYTNKNYLRGCRDMISRNLVADQIDYNCTTHIRSGAMDRRLKTMANAGFFATVVVVLAKVAMVDPSAPVVAEIWALLPTLNMMDSGDRTLIVSVLGFLAAFLPGLAAACYALRSHNELEIVSLRSGAMYASLSGLKCKLDKLDGDELTHGALADFTVHATTIMMHDSADWLDIFRVKESETA